MNCGSFANDPAGNPYVEPVSGITPVARGPAAGAQYIAIISSIK
jgi:hypothetical protein